MGLAFSSLSTARHIKHEMPSYLKDCLDSLPVQRTRIFIQHQTQPGETLVGIGASHRGIPVSLPEVDSELHPDYNSCHSSLKILSRDLEESLPLVHTTRSEGPHRNKANRYGDDYWMLEMDMDCSQMKDGWFEFQVMVVTSDRCNILGAEDVFFNKACEKGQRFEPGSGHHFK